jgi:hypothetical protein
MKTSAIWLLVTFLLASAIARGAPFEGRVLLHRAELPDEPHDIIYSVKGDNVRVEVVRDRVNSYLTDTAKQETTVIMEDDMAYLTMPSLAPYPDAPKLEKTGETTKILGYPVEKYVLDSDEGRAELWLAEGLGRYTGFGEGFEQPPPQVANVDLPEPVEPWTWEWVLAGRSLFPLRVIIAYGNGREFFRLEAIAITPQPLSDGLFVPSPNYKKLETWPEK